MINRQDIVWRLGLAVPLVLGSQFIFPLGRAAEDDWVVVTLARDGTWGAASNSSQGEAISAAVRACRAMAPRRNDCGALLKTSRGGWVVGMSCGDAKLLAEGQSLPQVEEAARDRERNLRLRYLPNLPLCRTIVTVDPNATAVGSEIEARQGP